MSYYFIVKMGNKGWVLQERESDVRSVVDQ